MASGPAVRSRRSHVSNAPSCHHRRAMNLTAVTGSESDFTGPTRYTSAVVREGYSDRAIETNRIKSALPATPAHPRIPSRPTCSTAPRKSHSRPAMTGSNSPIGTPWPRPGFGSSQRVLASAALGRFYVARAFGMTISVASAASTHVRSRAMRRLPTVSSLAALRPAMILLRTTPGL